MFIIDKLHAQAGPPDGAILGFTPTVQVTINPFPLESQLGVTFLYSPFRNSIPFRVLTCVTGSNGFSDVWAKDSKVKVTRLRKKKKEKKNVKKGQKNYL